MQRGHLYFAGWVSQTPQTREADFVGGASGISVMSLSSILMDSSFLRMGFWLMEVRFRGEVSFFITGKASAKKFAEFWEVSLSFLLTVGVMVTVDLGDRKQARERGAGALFAICSASIAPRYAGAIA